MRFTEALAAVAVELTTDHHVQVPDAAEQLQESRDLVDTLRTRLAALTSTSTSRGVSREYGNALDRWEASRAETRTRDTLTPELRAWEDSHRIDTARKAYRRTTDIHASTTTAPTSTPDYGPSR